MTTNGAREHTIDLRLQRIGQLFDSMDPLPFYEKDLDPDAEQFLTAHAEDASRRSRLRLRVHLDNPGPGEDAEAIIRQSVQNFYRRRTEQSRRRLREMMREGRTCLLIGVAFLAACIVAFELSVSLGEGAWLEVLRQSVLIAGWVAMWKPLEIFLYGWWPIRDEMRLHNRLSHIDVEVQERD
jgi:hypothetical protein